MGHAVCLSVATECVDGVWLSHCMAEESELTFVERLRTLQQALDFADLLAFRSR